MKKLIVLSTLFLILLYGCTNISKQPLLQYKTGIAGVDTRFATNAPPNSVFENTEFEIAFLIENKGAYDVRTNRGIVRLITDENILLLQPNYDVFSLLGRTPQNPEGEQQVRAFRVKARPLPTQTEVTSSAITAITCFPYETEASADVCIDTDVYGQIEARKKPCTAKPVSLTGQGAPVAITKVDTQIIPSGDVIKPQFIITIVNRGTGEVIPSSIVQRLCLGTASAEEKAEGAKVMVEDAVLGENPVICQPLEAKLKDKETTITCTTDVPIPRSTPTFLSSFNIKLSYGYFQTIGKSIEIKKSPIE